MSMRAWFSACGVVSLGVLSGSVLGDEPPTGPAAASRQAPGEAGDVPPVFSKVGFDEALGANKMDGRLLVVKFTAEWCGPCKMMDKTTWRDAKVVEFFKASGTALQVDVDQQREIAQRFNVRAMPTMIAFKGGEPLDRVVGYRDATALLSWLAAAKEGKTETGVMEDRAQRAGDKLSIRERLDLARSLLRGDKLEKATTEYLWLWSNMVAKEPSYVGVRSSFMANEIQDLCAQHPPAKLAFAGLRDEAEGRLKTENKTWEDLSDWITLNDVLVETDKTLAWYDRIKSDPDSGATLSRFSYRLGPLLLNANRWADYGRLIKSPVASIRGDWEMVALSQQAPGADAALRARLRELAIERFRGQAAEMYTALVAAGRGGEAQVVAETVVKLNDTGATRTVLVEKAVNAGFAHESMLDLLDGAAKAGENAESADIEAMRQRVRELLGKSAG